MGFNNIESENYRLVTVRVPSTGVIAAGASQNFTITQTEVDANRGNLKTKLNKLQIDKIIMHCVDASDVEATSVVSLKLYSDDARTFYKCIHEDMWGSTPTAVARTQDDTERTYVNEDGTNQIVGTIGVKAGETPVAVYLTVGFLN